MFSQTQEWLLLLVDVSIKVILLALIASSSLLVLRVKNSHIRHRIWTAVLVGMLIMPALVQVVPGLSIPVPGLNLIWEQPTEVAQAPVIERRGSSAPTIDNLDDDPIDAVPPVLPEFFAPDEIGAPPNLPADQPLLQVAPVVIANEAEESQSAPEAAAPTFVSIDWMALLKSFFSALVVTYIVVATLLAIRLLRCILRAALLVRRSRRLDRSDFHVDLPHRAILCENDSIRVPLTVGFLKPLVILPANWRDWSDDKLKAVLQHELTHIARGDYAVNLLSEWNRCLYWFHPLAWWLIRRLSDLAERNCDDAVIASTGDRTSYARHLIEIAASVMTPNGGTVKTGVSMARSSDVEMRIEAILDADRPLSKRIGWRSTLLLFAVVLPVVWFSAALQAAAPPDPIKSSRETTANANKEAEPEKESAKKPDEKLGVVFSGRVLDEVGQGVAGAKLHLLGVGSNYKQRKVVHLMGEANDAGRFTFTYDADNATGLSRATLVATGTGAGPDWISLANADELTDLTLRLASAKTTIEGRVLDLEGNPVAATVRVRSIRAMDSDSLDNYIRVVKAGNGSNFSFDKVVFPLSLFDEVKTDDKGRFRLSGMGDRRLVELAVVGPSIEHANLRVMTQKSKPIKGREGRGFPSDGFTYGASFEYLARPSRPIFGVVRDSETKKPVAGVTVGVIGPSEQTETDENGRFKVVGAPKGNDYRMVCYVAGGPYLLGSKRVDDTSGFDPLEVELTLPRGIVIRGQVTDKVSGDPVSAEVKYFPLYPNTNIKLGIGYSAVGGSGAYATAQTDADGNFEIGVLAGAGFLGVQPQQRREYETASVDAEAFFKDKFPYGGTIVRKHNKDLLYAASGTRGMGAMPQSNFQAIELLFIDANAKQTKRDIKVVSTAQINGIVLDPTGKPINGVRAFGLGTYLGRRPKVLADNTFAVVGMGGKETRTLIFQHEAKRLIAIAEVYGDQKKLLTIKLQKWGDVKGRMLDEQGEPLANLMIGSIGRSAEGELPGHLPRLHSTDDEGRFHIQGLMPGRTYRLRAFDRIEPSLRVIVEPGQSIDAGDVKGAKDVVKTAKMKPPRDKVAASQLTSTTANDEDRNSFKYRGRVVDSSGKPVADASIDVVYSGYRSERPGSNISYPYHRNLGHVKTDAAGRFDISFTDSWTRVVRDQGNRPGQTAYDAGPGTVLIASAKGLAPTWVSTFDVDPAKPLDLELQRDTKPISGRVVDLEGRPIADVRVSLMTFWLAQDGQVTGWLKELPKLRSQGLISSDPADLMKLDIRSPIGRYPAYTHVLANTPGIPTHVKTDTDGRFTIANVGDDRLAILQLESPQIVTERIAVVSRTMKPVQARSIGNGGPNENTYYGISFNHAAQPGVVVQGTIRDEESGEPIAASLSALHRRGNYISVVVEREWQTDADGRYRLEGLPKKKGLMLKVVPNSDQPYFAQELNLPEFQGLEPQTFDIKLRRGVMITGKLTDRRTGEPIQYARFDYFPLASNENAQRYRRYQTTTQRLSPMGYRFRSAEDGSFNLVGLPGKGIVGVKINDPKYLKGMGAEELDHLKHERENRFLTYDHCSPRLYNILALVDAKQGDENVVANLAAESGESIEFEVVDADGKPLTNYTINNHYDRSAKANRSTIYGFVEGRTRTIYFKDRVAKLGKAVTITGIPKVRARKLVLESFGSVTGHLVKNKDEPAIEGSIHVRRESIVGPKESPNFEVTTRIKSLNVDRDGRFLVSDLIVGTEYTFFVPQAGDGTQSVFIPGRIKVEPTKTVDLGVINITTGEIHPPKGSDDG